MTNKQIMEITRYFDKKGMGRKQLESVMDFDNLTMDEQYIPEIRQLLKDGDDAVGENIIRNYVRFVKERSGSGEITWDELIGRLKDLYLEDSDFGIRVQRFSKNAYWEVFFNHFDITNYENGVTKLTFNNDYYEDTENQNAYEIFEKYGFNTDFDTDADRNGIITQVAEKWTELSNEEKEDVVSALNTWFTSHYVDKSRVDITNDQIEKITMTNADLVPEVGLRDYTISFKDGDMIHLRF